MDSQIITDNIETGCADLHLSHKLTAVKSENSAGKRLYFDNQLLLCCETDRDGITFLSSDNKPLSIVLPALSADSQTDLPIGYALPVRQSECCLVCRYIVIYCEPYYLAAEVTADGDGYIRTDRDRSRMSVSGRGLTVSLDCFNTEDEALLSIWRYHLQEYRWHSFAAGVVIDYQDKRSDAVVYTDICHRLECSSILLLVNNCQADTANRTDLLLSTLKNRAALCGAKLILEFDGRQTSDQSDCECIMMRAGNKLNINGMTFIDILGDSGYDEAYRRLNHCLSHSDGIRYKMLTEYNADIDFDKVMLHSDSGLSEYRHSAGRLLNAIEHLTEPAEDRYRFISNIFCGAGAGLDMVLSDKADTDPISMCEQIIRQGYLNISIESDISTAMTDIWSLSEKLLTLFMTQTFIVTQDFIQHISLKDDLFKYFNAAISFRQSLDIMYYDIYHNPDGLNAYPYKTFCCGKRIAGVILNDSLYVGLSVRSLLRKMFTLPKIRGAGGTTDGQWYDIVNRCVLSPGSYLNKAKTGLHYFLAEGHILILRETAVSQDRYDDLRIIIFCSQRCHASIAESRDIIHKFDVNVAASGITVRYQTAPVSRMITFEIVLAGDEDNADAVRSVIYNGEEIFCSQDGITVQFMSSSILADNEINIMQS